MKALARTLVLLGFCFLIVGCESLHRKDYGMAAGGVAGGVAGSALTGGSTLGTVAGAVGGAYLGRQLTR